MGKADNPAKIGDGPDHPAGGAFLEVVEGSQDAEPGENPFEHG